MKTRQEMIYDFMLALSANGDVSEAWREGVAHRTYNEYILEVAKDLTDLYLKEQA